MNKGFGAFLEEDEKVLRVFRRPILFATPGFLVRGALWAALVFGVWFFYPAYGGLDISYVWQALALLGFVHTVDPLWKWYFNAIVMTNESLIVVDWPRLWERRSTRIDFHNLDEITVERNGVNSFLFNYGNLLLAKINGGGELKVKGISRPRRAARIMEDYREWHLDQKNFTEESALKGLLSGIVQRHVGDTGQPQRERRGQRYDTSYEPETNIIDAPAPPSTSAPKRAFRKKNFDDMPDLELEKDLDDTGGIDIDLDDTN